MYLDPDELEADGCMAFALSKQRQLDPDLDPDDLYLDLDLDTTAWLLAYHPDSGIRKQVGFMACGVWVQ